MWGKPYIKIDTYYFEPVEFKETTVLDGHGRVNYMIHCTYQAVDQLQIVMKTLEGYKIWTMFGGYNMVAKYADLFRGGEHAQCHFCDINSNYRGERFMAKFDQVVLGRE